MLKKYNRLFKLVLFLSDITLISLAYLFTYWAFYGLGPNPELLTVGHFIYPIVVIVLLFAASFKAFRLYRAFRVTSPFTETRDVLHASALSLLAIVTVLFFLGVSAYSRDFLAVFWGLAVGLVVVVRWNARQVLKYFRKLGYNQRRALIIGTGPLGQQIVKKLKHQNDLGIRVVGYITRDTAEIGKEIQGIKVLGGEELIDEIGHYLKVDQVYVALPEEHVTKTREVLSRLSILAVDLRIVSEASEFMSAGMSAELFGNLSITTLQAAPIDGWKDFLKRSFDLTFSSLALLVLWPLLIAIALLIKTTSAGPVLFIQPRVGYQGRIFPLLKFRTMCRDAEGKDGATWTTPGDPRRTSLGRFLRKFSLDELPQFFNVLMGHMSVVGPRPEQPRYVEEFRQSIPYYMARHKVRPGITGLAQISGWRGNTSIPERIKCDNSYIQKWSFWLDLKIIALTLNRGMFNHNAY